MVDSFRLLSDEQLLAEVRILVERERTATTVLVASLAELDARKLYLAQGFSSLYTYCTRELGLSSGAAYRRIAAARAAKRFPVALDHLADGSLTLTNFTLLAPHLTIDNHLPLIRAARFQTREQVETQVAALDPAAPDLVVLHVRVRRETRAKLRRAQDLLRHVFPDGNPADVIDRALTVLIADVEKKKLAKVSRPAKPRKAGPDSQEIPASVKRAVDKRDGGSCAFVGVRGRCGETGFLEFHHVDPDSLGGPPTVENIQLRCRAHNQYEGEQVFGPRRPRVRERPPVYDAPDWSCRSRMSSSTDCKSFGSGDSNSMTRPSDGCVNFSRAEWRNGRSSRCTARMSLATCLWRPP